MSCSLIARFSTGYIAEEGKPEICREFDLSSLQFDQILFRARTTVSNPV
jgi:hypothetical protein